MPAVYAHHSFGRRVHAACRNKTALAAIGRWPGLFGIGLQGPDILFYYDPLRGGALKAAGDRMHDAPAAPFFEAGAAAAASQPAGQALLSYLLGCTCHFALDSACHSYIEWEIGRSGHSHTAIETAFDARLMLADGVDWGSTNPAGYLEITETACRTIARVMPAGRTAVRRCLVNMKGVGWLLMPGAPLRQAAVAWALGRAGKLDAMGGLLASRVPLADYEASYRTLRGLYDGAVAEALALMDSLCARTAQNTPLAPRFGRSYGPCEELMAQYAPQG